ncbi:DMT family transporter [Kitasatospora sp. KL5]|uniref:DMT family transporter n=1 Tax=Kitasatospora sp. KL5 TaxID=3425125 RepID=UPI003D6F8124
MWLLPSVSTVCVAVPYALINYGGQRISSGFASVLFASVTVLLVAFSRLISRITVLARQWVGIAAGLVCLTVLVQQTCGGLGARDLLAPAAVLAAAVLHALTCAVPARHAADIHVLTVEVLPIGIGGALLLGLGVAAGMLGASTLTRTGRTGPDRTRTGRTGPDRPAKGGGGRVRARPVD